ncbi:MAG: response regulator [Eubacterium sp.]|nr:response regulator [Eubacterium sp.]
MKLQIMVTGQNRRVASDLCEHLESDRGYLTVKCPSNKSALFDVLLAEVPNVIIICLGNETLDSILSYNVMKDAVKGRNCSIIVVANEEDETYFKKHSVLDKVYFLSRPVPLLSLYEMLIRVEEKMEKDKEESLSAFREYENENAAEYDRRRHILLVDDDTEQLVNIKEQLREFYNVTPVKSGEAAFRFLQKIIPDLILLDYMMPEEDGPSVLRRMRENPKYEDIPVVFLTGMTEKNAVIRTLTELKPQGYVIKPSKKSELVAKIIDVLEGED